MQVDVIYYRIPMTLVGDYTPREPQSHASPGYPACFEIEAILVGGVNIDGIVNPDEIDHLAALACDTIAKNRADNDAADAIEAWEAAHEEV